MLSRKIRAFPEVVPGCVYVPFNDDDALKKAFDVKWRVLCRAIRRRRREGRIGRVSRTIRELCDKAGAKNDLVEVQPVWAVRAMLVSDFGIGGIMPWPDARGGVVLVRDGNGSKVAATLFRHARFAFPRRTACLRGGSRRLKLSKSLYARKHR
jgi:hypothetical protein